MNLQWPQRNKSEVKHNTLQGKLQEQNTRTVNRGCGAQNWLNFKLLLPTRSVGQRNKLIAGYSIQIILLRMYLNLNDEYLTGYKIGCMNVAILLGHFSPLLDIIWFLHKRIYFSYSRERKIFYIMKRESLIVSTLIVLYCILFIITVS